MLFSNAVPTKKHDDTDRAAGHALAWASVTVGMIELLATKHVQRLLGVGGGHSAGVIRAMGVREVMQGVDLFAHPNDPTPGTWARVAGDVLDGTLLAATAASSKRPAGVVAAFALVLPLVAADVLLAPRMTANKRLI